MVSWSISVIFGVASTEIEKYGNSMSSLMRLTTSEPIVAINFFQVVLKNMMGDHVHDWRKCLCFAVKMNQISQSLPK